MFFSAENKAGSHFPKNCGDDTQYHELHFIRNMKENIFRCRLLMFSEEDALQLMTSTDRYDAI